VDMELICKDGSPLPVRLSVAFIYDKDGNCTGCQGAVRNISRERELERQLSQAQKMEALGTLASGVAHDFNNLLMGIIGFAELALQHLEPGTKVYDFISRIPTQGQRAANLIRSLLLFARGTVAERRPLELASILKETVKMLRRTIPENISISLEIAPDLWAVNADPTQVQQVVVNLAVNSRDAMPEGGNLTIAARNIVLDREQALQPAPGNYVLLSVRDTGFGMPPEVKERAFEPFFTTKEPGKGSGLGLSVVYGIVKQHEGHIEIDSEVGKGTEVRIYLPALVREVVEEEAVAEPVPTGTETILLVEDEAAVLETGREMLQSLGYRVLTASNGEEALRVYRELGAEIQLVLTDMVMPDMDGARLFRELSRINPRVKVLIMSGYAPGDHLEGLLKEGVISFIPKPFGHAELARQVRAALDRPER